MTIRRILCLLLLAAALPACQSRELTIPNFDAAVWRADPRACTGERASQWPALRVSRTKLMNASEPQIMALLGRPDRNDLGERGQRTYRYYVVPGTQCAEPNTLAPLPELLLHFNALDNVNEVRVAP